MFKGPRDRVNGPGAWPTLRSADVIHSIVRLVSGRVTGLFGPRTVGSHSSMRAPNVVHESRAVYVPRGECPWLLDVETGRVRRWGRRGLVPPAGDWRPLLRAEGTDLPPACWKEPGTPLRPRVVASVGPTDGRAAGREVAR
jgi:hypothetical protein